MSEENSSGLYGEHNDVIDERLAIFLTFGYVKNLNENESKGVLDRKRKTYMQEHLFDHLILRFLIKMFRK